MGYNHATVVDRSLIKKNEAILTFFFLQNSHSHPLASDGNAGVFHVLLLWTITIVFYVTPSCVILCLHTSLPFCQHGKNKSSTTIGKNATKCPFVRLLAAENDKAKLRNNDLGQGDCLRKGLSCGQEGHCCEERLDHTLVLWW